MKAFVAIFALIVLSNCRTVGNTSGLKGTFLESVPYGLTERCENGKAKYWGQKIMDIDLMHLYLRNKGIGEEANVSVIDSGFDSTQQDSYETVGKVKTARGVLRGDVHPTKKPPYKVTRYGSGEYIGDPEKDPNGHGTMVSSVIGGKGLLGVAKNVKLNVYRVTKQGSGGSTSSEVLQMSMHKACLENLDPKGINVVNVSWGGRFDEGGLQPDEKKEEFAALLNIFAEKGCLIIKSAGNSNFRADREFNVDDPYLRVAAIDTSLQLSSFSTIGEVQAPGSDVYVFDSSQAIKYRAKDRKCGEEEHRTFVNGTSFSAPFTAAVASQVVRVLKHYKAFEGMPNPQRISLVNRILQSSQLAGSINGLRAVHFAYLFANATPEEKNLVLKPGGIDLIQKKLSRGQEKVCKKTGHSCIDLKEDSLIRQCVSLSRARLALCPNVTNDEMVDLARTSFRQDAYEKGYHYMKVAQSFKISNDVVFSLLKEATEQYLKKLGYYDQKDYNGKINKFKQEQVLGKMNPNFVREVIAPYIAEYVKRKKMNPEIMEGLARQIMTSLQIKRALEMGFDPDTGEDRGSGSVLKGVTSILESAKKVLGPQRFLKLVEKIAEDEINDIAYDIDFKRRYESSLTMDESTSTFRILDSIAKPEAPGSTIHNTIRGLERKLLTEIRKTNQFYAHKTTDLPIYFEYYPTRSIIEPAIKRNIDLSLSQLNRDMSQLSAPEVFYLMKNRKELNLSSRSLDMAMEIFRIIADGRGWGEQNDKELIERAFIIVLEVSKTNPDRIVSAKQEFFNIARNSHNIGFSQVITNGWTGNRTFFGNIADWFIGEDRVKERKENGLSYRQSPILSEDVIKVLSIKSLSTLQNIKPEELKNTTHFELTQSLSKISHHLYLNNKLDPNLTVQTNKFSKMPLDRVNPSSGRLERNLVPIGSLDFNLLVQQIIKFSRHKESRRFAGELVKQTFEPLGKYIGGYMGEREKNQMAVIRNMDTNEPWYPALKEFVKEAKEKKLFIGAFYIEQFLANVLKLGKAPRR